MAARKRLSLHRVKDGLPLLPEMNKVETLKTRIYHRVIDSIYSRIIEHAEI